MVTVELAADLVGWIEQVTGGTVTSARRTYGGGTRLTWFVDVDRDSAPLPLVARIESGQSAFAGSPLTLAREAVVYRALAPTPVRVPELHAERPDGTALLLSRVPGTSNLRRLPSDEVRAALEDLVRQLVVLHELDPADLALSGFARPETTADHALCDLATWEAVSTACPRLEPEAAYAFAWLRTHAPTTVQRSALVQGDTGPGNFVVLDGRVTGLVDWEFAHIGDPLDDLAWLEFRTCGRYPPTVPYVKALLQLYARESGLELLPASQTYYAAFVQLRCAITTALTIARGGNVGLAAYRSYERRFLRATVEAIGAAEGVAPPPPAAAAADTSRTALFDSALRELTEGVVPSLTSAAVKIRANDAIILLRHLRAVDRLGPELERSEAEDLEAVLGPGHHDPDGHELVALAAEAGSTGDRDLLGYLLRRAIRKEAVWIDAFV
jgi:aminoglycoside phosphotransferase (APT) family kinase protein